MASRKGTVRLTARGTWQARWYAPTTPGTPPLRKHKNFPTERAALDFLDTVGADKQRNTYLDPHAGKVTFNQVADEWVETLIKKPKTLAGYKSLLDIHVRPSFGTMQVRHITTTEIRKWLATMARKGAAPGTVRNAYRVLRPVLQTAVESECLARNPCDAIRPATDLPRPRRTEMLFLDASEVRRLAEATAEPYGVLIYLAAYTGLRAGEIAALRMQHVDLLRRRVRVVESVSEVGGAVYIVTPKNGRDRTVPLTPELTRRLRAYLETQPGKGPRDFLFTGPAKRGATTARREDFIVRHNAWLYQQVFKPAVNAAGLNPSLRFHDLRHTCAALQIALGAPPKAISDWLGHSTISVTMDTYGHLLPSVEEATVSGLDAMDRAAQTRTTTA